MSEYIIPQEMNQSDRIGNFTIAQAGVMGSGIMLILFMLAILPTLVALVVDIPLAMLTIFLMYKKKYNIPIYEFFFVYITYRSMPKLYVYRTNNIKDEYEEDNNLDFLIDEHEEEEEVKK